MFFMIVSSFLVGLISDVAYQRRFGVGSNGIQMSNVELTIIIEDVFALFFDFTDDRLSLIIRAIQNFFCIITLILVVSSTANNDYLSVIGDFNGLSDVFDSGLDGVEHFFFGHDDYSFAFSALYFMTVTVVNLSSLARYELYN